MAYEQHMIVGGLTKAGACILKTTWRSI